MAEVRRVRSHSTSADERCVIEGGRRTSAAKYETARAEPTSPAEAGTLCVAYHADMFFDEANRCYALVTELDSSNWRWRYYRTLIQAERGGGESLVEDLRRVVTQAPDFGSAWQRLGDALFKARQYDEAREAWRPANMTPAADSNQPSPRHVTEVPLSAYAVLRGCGRLAGSHDGHSVNQRSDHETVLLFPELTKTSWPLARPPYLLDTSRPGIFAVGDVRGGNVKRVASAVGEGSIAVAFVHQVLRH